MPQGLKPCSNHEQVDFYGDPSLSLSLDACHNIASPSVLKICSLLVFFIGFTFNCSSHSLLLLPSTEFLEQNWDISADIFFVLAEFSVLDILAVEAFWLLSYLPGLDIFPFCIFKHQAPLGWSSGSNTTTLRLSNSTRQSIELNQ